jgi:hypothetical protein
MRSCLEEKIDGLVPWSLLETIVKCRTVGPCLPNKPIRGAYAHRLFLMLTRYDRQISVVQSFVEQFDFCLLDPPINK